MLQTRVITTPNRTNSQPDKMRIIRRKLIILKVVTLAGRLLFFHLGGWARLPIATTTVTTATGHRIDPAGRMEQGEPHKEEDSAPRWLGGDISGRVGVGGAGIAVKASYNYSSSGGRSLRSKETDNEVCWKASILCLP
jgi:hypothetical protein